MQSTKSLLNNLLHDFPDFTFTSGDKFLWSDTTKTIHYDPTAPNSPLYLLHELSHAILGHSGYDRDIELLKIEREAWRYTQQELAPLYRVFVDYDTIQDNLDTYRLWMHERSTCPKCTTTGLQTRHQNYRCIACGHTWRVNESRLCALRRYSLATTK